jgi:O-antigen/teichoic acid export membrane protein
VTANGADTQGSQARRILAGTSYRLAADLVAKAASFLLWAVMARRLGQGDFGAFTFGLAFVTLVASLASFGQDYVLTREVARRPDRFGSVFASTVGTKLALGIPALAVALGILALTGASAQVLAVTALLAVAALAEILTSTCYASFQAFERLGLISVALTVQRLLAAGLAIGALLAGAGIVVVAALYSLASVAALWLAVYLLVTRIARPGLRVAPRTWPALLRASIPIGAASLFAVVLFRVDITMLAAFESEAVVGAYGAAYRLFEATLFLPWAAGAALYPVFSRLTRNSEPPLALVFERGLKLVLALLLPFAVGAFLLATPVLEAVYGPEFGNATDALRILAPAIALYGISYIAGYLLVARDRQRTLAVLYGLVALANVGGNLVLIPLFSLEGAAAATTACEVAVAATTLVLARRLAGPVSWGRVGTGPLLATAVAAALMVVLAGTPGLAIAAAAGAYLAVLAAVERALWPADARFVLDFVRRRPTLDAST